MGGRQPSNQEQVRMRPLPPTTPPVTYLLVHHSLLTLHGSTQLSMFGPTPGCNVSPGISLHPHPSGWEGVPTSMCGARRQKTSHGGAVVSPPQHHPSPLGPAAAAAAVAAVLLPLLLLAAAGGWQPMLRCGWCRLRATPPTGLAPVQIHHPAAHNGKVAVCTHVMTVSSVAHLRDNLGPTTRDQAAAQV